MATHAAAEVPLVSQAEADAMPPATLVAQRKAEESACKNYADAFVAGLEYGSEYAGKIPGWKSKCEHSPECRSTKTTIERARGISALKCN